MSTRCTIHFHYAKEEKPSAIIYRHSDGYPEGVLPDLNQFFGDVQAQTKDTRFNDPNYLAAKFVVWQADQNAWGYDFSKEPPRVKKEMLNFLSVGVVMKDPGDIEYRYHVWCSGRDRPEVTHEST